VFLTATDDFPDYGCRLSVMPFDPSLAQLPTRRLPIAEVIDVLTSTHAPERVAEYRERMLRGDRFPPVSVIRFARRFILADGHKRLAAYRTLGHSTIVVEIWTYRRFVRDQWQQARKNARKNQRIVIHALTDPPEARRLILSTALHWKRVGGSLRDWCVRLLRAV
jgi:hypothetical protein